MTVGEFRDECMSIPDLRLKWDALVDSAMALYPQEMKRGAKLQSTGKGNGEGLEVTRSAYDQAYAALKQAASQASITMPDFELFQICELYR